YRSTARLARDMADAMRSRAVIEQAKGMLMADQRIDADQAFQRLTELSQRSNVKLRDIAQRLVDERTDPPNPA
ncbi:MAG: ANTAR domain-containing protein, partial [Gaiellales bacterium]